jgi:EAL domain-containing protein (putative c-di-GMP-specific phosphodiesterase class I)
MEIAANFKPVGCSDCRDLNQLGIKFTMAFQPIVNFHEKTIFGYEALVRGPNNEGAAFILSQVTDVNRYKFDQAIRVKALDLAKKLNLQGMLSINFLPNAVYRPETCIRATLEAAAELNFPTNRIMFEVTEGEKVLDHDHLKKIFIEYKKQNFTTAIDDFGAGYAGLNLLADWQPDVIKLDMSLTRNIHNDRVRRSLASGIITVCKELSIKIIAEGIESREERDTLYSQGVHLFQGYYFARPGFECLPSINKEALE